MGEGQTHAPGWSTLLPLTPTLSPQAGRGSRANAGERPWLHAHPDRPLDPVGGLRPAGRGGARHRPGRLRLGARRRHGRPFRAQHHHRARRGGRHPPAHQEGARRAPDDRAGRSLHRGVRQGRLRHHHRARGSRPASRPLAAADPLARQEGRRLAHAADAGERDRLRARPARPDPGDDGEPGLRRPGLHSGHGRQDRAHPQP